LFNLLDNNSPIVGDRLANEIFTSDGMMIASAGKAEGSEGIKAISSWGFLIYSQPAFAFKSSAAVVVENPTSNRPSVFLAAIRKSRNEAWKVIKTRRRKVLRVYAHDTEGLDLLIIGNVTMGLPNDKEVAGEFTARIVFVADEKQGNPKIKLYTVWAVWIPSPLVCAILGQNN
jgi:hypothetical protein